MTDKKTIGIDKYSTFGLREQWLEEFLYLGDVWLENNSLGPRQIPALNNWLSEADLIDPKTKKATQLRNDLKAIYKKDPYFVWGVVWINLYYNSKIIRWYCDNIDWNETITKEELLTRLNNSFPNLSKTTLNNPLSALINLFDNSPLNNAFNLGNLTKKGRAIRFIDKKGVNKELDIWLVIYSLYKVKEHQLRLDFKVSEIYDKNFEGGPYKLFGISKKQFEMILKSLQQLRENVIEVDLDRGLDNIFLNDIFSEDIIKFKFLYDDTEHIKENSNNKTQPPYFELTTNTLYTDQVSKELGKINNNLKLKELLDDDKLKEIKDSISKKVIREIEIEIKDAIIQEERLITYLKKGIFKKSGYLHMILFLCKTDEELLKITHVVKSISEKGLLDDIIIVISESSFKEENLDRCLEFKARTAVAKRFDFSKDIKLNTEYANKLITAWISKIKNSIVSWYFDKKEGKTSLNTLHNTLNQDISKQIFSKGLENIDKTRENKNIWTYKRAKMQAEKFLTSQNYEELANNLSDTRSLVILKDNNNELIINDNLDLKKTVPKDHPIKLIQDFVDQQLQNSQKIGKFSLGKTLKPLSKPPYGLYPNIVNISAFSFVLRKYVDKLYDDEGNSINATMMKDYIMNIFEYWSNNKKEEKLIVHFES